MSDVVEVAGYPANKRRPLQRSSRWDMYCRQIEPTDLAAKIADAWELKAHWASRGTFIAKVSRELSGIRGECLHSAGTLLAFQAEHFLGFLEDLDNTCARIGIAAGGRTAPRLPSDVAEFCAETGIGAHLETAIELAKETFTTDREPELKRQHDPEAGDEWIVVRLVVTGDRSRVREQYHEYLRKFTQRTPAEALEKIRLIYIRT